MTRPWYKRPYPYSIAAVAIYLLLGSSGDMSANRNVGQAVLGAGTACAGEEEGNCRPCDGWVCVTPGGSEYDDKCWRDDEECNAGNCNVE